MRILHLRSSEFFGGPERAIIGQCTHSKRHEMSCASFVRKQNTNDFLRQCEHNGIETVALPEGFAGDLRVINRLRRVLSEHGINIVVSHDYKANFVAHHATRKSESAHIAHFRGRTREDIKVRLYNALDDYMLRRIETVLVVSKKSKQQLTERGVRAEVIKVIPNAISEDKLLAQRPVIIRAPETPVSIIAAGRLSHEKGFDLLIEAAARLRDSAQNFSIVIYGTGPDEAPLKKMIDRLEVGGEVRLAGFVDDLLPIMREADLLVLPSRSEGMPNVILEAWSQHLGVVATAVGGVPEMISSGDNGVLVMPEDVGALAEALRQALQDPARMAEYGKKGFETVRDRYSFSRQAELLNAVYEDVVSRQAGR